MGLFKRLKALFSHEQVRLDVQVQAALAQAVKDYLETVTPAKPKQDASSAATPASNAMPPSADPAAKPKPTNQIRYSIVIGDVNTHTPQQDDGVRYSIASYPGTNQIERQLDQIVGQAARREVLTALQQTKPQTFVELLRRHIYRLKLTGPQVYHAALMDKRLYSKIISNSAYQPSRETALALALAIRLPLFEAKELLSRAGYTLSETCRRDQILVYFFQHPQPSLIMINGVLETLNESPIGQR